MSLKLHLAFDHWGTEVWLSETDFENPDVGASKMGNRFHGRAEGLPVFPWHKPAKALAVLVVRSFATGQFRPYTLAGLQGSLASALWDAIAKPKKFDWLKAMFPVPGKAHLQTTLFRLSKSKDASGKIIYEVALDPYWSGVDFKVTFDGKPIPADHPAELSDLAGQIESQAAVADADPEADLDILILDQANVPSSFRQRGVLPVHFGTRLQVEVTIHQPAHYYVIWLAGNGQRHPLHPWRELKWESSFKDSRTSGLLALLPGLKPGERRAFHIDTPAGIETLLLIARRKALPEEQLKQLQELVVTAPAGFLFPPAQPFREFEWQAAQEDPGLQTRLSIVTLPSDPLDRFHQELIDRLKLSFRLIEGVSIANAGPTTGGGHERGQA